METQKELITTQPTAPSRLLELAIVNKADITQLEKLMELYEIWEKRQAEKQFYEALSLFQSKVPPIPKSAMISFSARGGNVQYKYAPLGAIAPYIQQYLADTGLSYRWDITTNDDNSITVACIVSHVSGHSTRTCLKAPFDSTGAKNEIQARGSTITYLQRYTLIAALGISTADEDLDGVNEEQINGFNRILDIWDKNNYLKEKASTITTKSGFSQFMKDLPTEQQLNRFKSLISQISDTEKEDRLWDAFQRQYNDTADEWLNTLEKNLEKLKGTIKQSNQKQNEENSND